MAETSAKTLHTSLGKLDISHDSKKAKPVKEEPADSWEDEAGSDTETETEPRSPLHPSTSDPPSPPPPTPASYGSTIVKEGSVPLVSPGSELWEAMHSNGSNSARRSALDSEDKRPEKSTAVASRLIAAGLGQKAPRRTKEQREYDQAMKVQEKKRRDAVREEEKRRVEEREKAKRDMWGD